MHMNIKLAEIIGVLIASAIGSLYLWTEDNYKRIAQSSPAIAIDEYVHHSKPSFTEKLQCVLLHWHTRLTYKIHKQPFPLVATEDANIANLKRTRAAQKGETTIRTTSSTKPKPPLVIGTIRMGFGHHRIAYGVASFATNNKSITQERDVYFHDIATIGHDESSLIDNGETLYSFASRALTELPNKLERTISKATSSGGPNALRLQVQTAANMLSLLQGLDRNSPIIATHPLVGAIAVQAGFTTVINMVVDNHCQWFVVVPGALNLVQGPRLYRELLKLGVPDQELELVGHWNPRTIVETIPEATERRIARVTASKPLRLLIPVGGAGAQQSFLVELVQECAPLVKEGKLELFLNAGDHDHMKTAFEEQLKESDLEYESILDLDGRNRLEDRFKQGKGPDQPVTLFAYSDDPYAAVSTTDELIPYSDVLVCKPSEMAFYAIPKLMIRRVGDHEAKSAVRASEVGDGTLEAATIPEVMREIDQFLAKPSDLITMNRRIQANHEIGMYNGSQIAIERALERARAVKS